MGPHLTGYPSGYPYRTLFVWVALLALSWIKLCSPWPAGWNMVCLMLVVFVTLVAIVVTTRRMRVRREATRRALHAVDAALSSLPADVKRNTPLVIAVGHTGDELAQAFGADPVRMTDSAVWVRHDDPARLMHVADALKRWRDGQGPDAVAYLLAADQAMGSVTLHAGLKRWCSAIGEASRAVGYPLPVCVALYARETRGTADECPWFGVSGIGGMQPGRLTNLIAARLAQYTHMASPEIAEERQARAHRTALLDSLVRWAAQAILPAFAGTQRGTVQLAALGVTGINGRPASDSPYGRFVTGITELPLCAADGAALSEPSRMSPGGRCRLPEPLIRGIQPQPVRRALPRALAHAFVCLAAGFCAAAAAAAWQNRALVERVVGDMARYTSIAPAQAAARVDALKAIHRDRDELERYARSGVPPRLGLGLYRGTPWLAPINALIAGYQPPVPPPTIELDSMSLFRSGSAVLSSGSNRVLVGALQMIKAHPDKRVLIAGHTDSIGNPASNLKLSEARAASVRDWLADAPGIAPTRLAIQGYGDTRPKAANDTDAGRAANRRVEITLVPDCRKPQLASTNGNDSSKNGSAPQGQPACLFE
ncbi:flagellar motor protein MotB [Burkholderia sp. SG-MS1]|uniref:OmpA family protein n=1 Tax=Paraburkholderia sp. SG-MS1 TaxID=2023741 RepID=UPI001448227E|nr:OmpA family protein [Paraburkholderia sp. SG-MS1]NKJ48394.1 flagellar motor protein MotB [Paraburkholderia sp. SG-MS1]